MLENLGQEEMQPFMKTPSFPCPRHGEGRAGLRGNGRKGRRSGRA